MNIYDKTQALAQIKCRAVMEASVMIPKEYMVGMYGMEICNVGLGGD